MRIQPLRESDIPFAIRLTDTEEWGYTREDFLRFSRLEPEGCLVAWEGNRRVGLTIVTVYGEMAWIGSVIVTKADRGKGYGRALVEAAIRYGEGRGVLTNWLNAYAHTVDFYESLGFRDSGSTIRLTGVGKGVFQPEVRLAHVSQVEDIARMDERYFGSSRLRLLRELYHDYGESFLSMREAGGLAYLVAAPFKGGVEVGPWVSDPTRAEAAVKLFQHALALFPNRTFSLNVPWENLQARQFLEALGFKEAFKTARMYMGKGKPAIQPEGIFALAGLEKG